MLRTPSGPFGYTLPMQDAVCWEGLQRKPGVKMPTRVPLKVEGEPPCEKLLRERR